MSDKKILLFNFRTIGPYAPGWDSIPEDLGFKIIDKYFSLHANGIGFGGFKTKNEISELEAFKNWQPDFLSQSKFYAFGNNDEMLDIAVFKLNERVINLFKEFPYESYSIAFKGFDTDDIVFFKDLKEIGKIVPYESRFEFLFESDEQKKDLLNVDERIQVNLHSEQELKEAGV